MNVQPTRECDLVISLGPNCRNAWNLRSHFGLEHVFPFDWWTTPARSALRMLEPSFRFDLSRDDLIFPAQNGHNTVYNRRLNLLHHHDFAPPRATENDGTIRDIPRQKIENVQAKYAFLFERMQRAIALSTAPVFVVNQVYAGFGDSHDGIPTAHELNAHISTEDFAEAVRSIVGKKARVLDIADGERAFVDAPWGWFVRVPDGGRRELSPDHFAEPVHVHREGLRALGLRISQRHLKAS